MSRLPETDGERVSVWELVERMLFGSSGCAVTGREVRQDGDTVTTEDGVTRVAVPVFTARDEDRIRELVRDELNEVARTTDLFVRRLFLGDDPEPLLDDGEPLVDLENAVDGVGGQNDSFERGREVVDNAIASFRALHRSRHIISQPSSGDGAGRQVVAPDLGEIGIRNFVSHLNLLTSARAATRYVAAAISLPPRWLQRMGWFRRPPLTPCARPSDTTSGGDA